MSLDVDLILTHKEFEYVERIEDTLHIFVNWM